MIATAEKWGEGLEAGEHGVVEHERLHLDRTRLTEFGRTTAKEGGKAAPNYRFVESFGCFRVRLVGLGTNPL